MLQEEVQERNQYLFEQKKKKSRKTVETDIKIFLKKKKSVSIIEIETKISIKKKNKRKLSI